MSDKKQARRSADKTGKAAPSSEQTPAASGYGRMLFAIIEKQLESPSKRRAYISPEQIARALRKNSGVPLPPMIHDYLCDMLEGKIKTPAGRPPDVVTPVKQIKKALIPPTYERYLAWLQKRKRTTGLAGWAMIQDADWWQGPPNERAARMTRRRFRFAMDWRRVKNIVSEANK